MLHQNKRFEQHIWTRINTTAKTNHRACDLRIAMCGRETAYRVAYSLHWADISLHFNIRSSTLTILVEWQTKLFFIRPMLLYIVMLYYVIIFEVVLT